MYAQKFSTAIKTILTILTKTEKEKHFGNPVTRKKEEKNERARKSSR